MLIEKQKISPYLGILKVSKNLLSGVSNSIDFGLNVEVNEEYSVFVSGTNALCLNYINKIVLIHYGMGICQQFEKSGH